MGEGRIDMNSASISLKLSDRIRRFAEEMGADLIGFAGAGSFSEASGGKLPEDLLQGAKSVIVIAIRLPDAIIDTAPSREYSIAYTTANRELDRMAFEIARFLQREKYKAVQVPASMPYDYARNMGDLSHRHAAYFAGLGVFGKSSLLLSEFFGPRIRLVSVVTDAPLMPGNALENDLCGSCNRCIEACPVSALKGEGIVDKVICDAYHAKLGEELNLDDSEQACGSCIRACPIGKS